MLAKWLAVQPKCLIVDEPTRGIDVGTKAEIYALFDELAHAGVPILMISSDLPEVLALADRIVVMRHGRIAGELNRTEASEEKIMHLTALLSFVKAHFEASNLSDGVSDGRAKSSCHNLCGFPPNLCRRSTPLQCSALR